MQKLQLEIIEQGQHNQELKDFWLKKWNLAMKKLVGEEITDQPFYEQSYFYVIKHEYKIIGVMSSTWQNTHANLANEHYYSAYPQTVEFLARQKIQRFHRMGMIIADLRSFPKGLKFTPIIIGCGLNFVFTTLKKCEAVVSFPRTDTTVFRSCLEWGSESIKSELTLYGCPVNLVHVDRETFKLHANENIRDTVTELLKNAIVKLNFPVRAQTSDPMSLHTT